MNQNPVLDHHSMVTYLDFLVSEIKDLDMAEPKSAKNELPTNLRRLIFFHHRSAREAAEVLGIAERTLSQWMTGKRVPGYRSLLAIDAIYGLNPMLLEGDPYKFAQELANPERMRIAEEEIERFKKQRRKAALKSV